VEAEFAVFVVSTNERVLSVFPHLIERHPALLFCGSAATPSEALDSVRAAGPRVVVTDWLPSSGQHVLKWRAVRELGPSLLMLTNYLREPDAVLSVLSSASGHLLTRPGQSRHLLDAIVRVAQGELLFPEGLVSKLRTQASGDSASDLDEPDRRVLLGLLERATDQEIAEALGEDANQVRLRIASLADKLS
jgi:DNA-binding NarL/FixJ family response regulator